MAKQLLWMIVIIIWAASIFLYLYGKEVELSTKIITLSLLGILAICESIESLNKKS